MSVIIFYGLYFYLDRISVEKLVIDIANIFLILDLDSFVK